MYINVKKTVFDPISNAAEIYGEIYCDTAAEADGLTASDFATGTQLYIVPTGATYVACATGWFDLDGNQLSQGA